MVDARRWLVCAFLAGVTAALVFPGLESRPFWLDEAYTVANARTPLPEIGRLNGGNMVGYYALVAPLARGSLSTLLWLRLPGAVAAIAVPPAVFLVLRRTMPPWSALGAALLVAVHPVAIGHAQEARSYPIAMLLVVLAWGAFLRATSDDRSMLWWVSLTGLLTLAAYMHLITMFVIPAMFLAVLYVDGSRGHAALKLCGTALGVAVLTAPLLWWATNPDAGAPVWIPELSDTQLAEMAKALMPSAWTVGTAAWAGCLVAGLAIVLRGTDPRPEGRTRLAGVLGAWVLVPLLALAVLSLVQPMFMPRYVMYTVPAVAGVTVIALMRLPARLQVASYCLLGLLAVSAYPEASQPFDEASLWPEVVCELASVPRDALIVFPAPRDRTPVDLQTEMRPECTPSAMVWPAGDWGVPRRRYATGGWEELPLGRLPEEAWLVWRDIGLTAPLREQAHADLRRAGYERASSTVYGYSIILERWHPVEASDERHR